MESIKPKFLLIGGFESSLINFRGPLIKQLLVNYEVYAAAPFIEKKTISKLESMGVNSISNKFERTGLNPIKDFLALLEFRKQIKNIQPDLVLAYTIKPIVYGLIAAKFHGGRRFALITGKGSGFQLNGLKGRVLSAIVRFLYRNALKSVDGVIFQNSDDQRFFQSKNLINVDAYQTVIQGTGVDMTYYRLRQSVSIPKKVKFLFIARLIKEKGIPELIRATEFLKAKSHDFEVQILGWVDPKPGGITQKEIEKLHQSGLVNYLGTTEDVRPYIENSDVFVLPTYYNEGLPRTIQEAMAMKKPIITTDHPGCRETVEVGENGFLIPKRDARALAEAMEYFILNPQKVLTMGEVSYKMAKEMFDVDKINKRLIKFINSGV